MESTSEIKIGTAREQTFLKVVPPRGTSLNVVDDRITGRKIAVPSHWRECELCKRWMPPGSLTNENGPQKICSMCKDAQKELKRYGHTKKEIVERLIKALEAVPEDDCVVIRSGYVPVTFKLRTSPGDYRRVWNVEIDE